MAVAGIDHANIRTTDVPGTIAFFRDVLGMAAVIPPGATSLDRGGWLLDEAGNAVIHVGGFDVPYPTDDWRPPLAEPRAETGRLHHVALKCTGFEDLRARVQAAGHDLAESTIASIGLRQLFVAEPNGVLLELNFWGD